MSEANRYGVQANILADLVKSHFSQGDIGRASPFVMYKEKLDELLILEEDCSYTEEPTTPCGFIAILRKNHGKDAGRVVGVIIYRWSQWKKNF